MSNHHLDDANSGCLKCERPFKESEVTASVLWWVGYEVAGSPKALAEQVVYRYCYRCAQRLDLGAMRIFQLSKNRFRLEGAVDVPNPAVLAHCHACSRDVLAGKPFAKIRVVLEFQKQNVWEELLELYAWIYCWDCAPKVDLDNVYIMETETPVDLLQHAQESEGRQDPTASGSRKEA